MTTETLDKIYLEWSYFTSARSQRELKMRDALELAEAAITHVQKHLKNGAPLQEMMMNRAQAAIAGALIEFNAGR